MTNPNPNQLQPSKVKQARPIPHICHFLTPAPFSVQNSVNHNTTEFHGDGGGRVVVVECDGGGVVVVVVVPPPPPYHHQSGDGSKITVI